MNENLKFVSPRVISLAEETQGSEIYISIKLVLLDSLVNLNNIQYSKEFLQDIEDRKQEFIAIPLMAEVSKLESGKYNNLTHAFNSKTGKFKSQMIGSFVNFYTQESPDNSEILELIGECRVPKRFEKTTAALQELYDNSSLQFSYEVACGEYSSIDGIKYVDKSDKNFLFAMAVVSNPAVISAKALTLVAAIEEDFNILEEGEILPGERSKDTFTMDEMFKNTKVHLSTELAELDLNQIRKKIYNALKGKFADDYWNYDIIDQFPNYVIVQYWNTGDYYKLTYTVSDSDVTLADPVKVTKNYVEIQEVDNVTVAELEGKVKELETQIASKDTIIAEKETIIQSKDTEIAELNTKVTTLSESVITKDTELAELKTVKASYDTIMAEKAESELAEKKTILKEKYSKLLDETVLAEVEIAEAIDNLNEDVLKNKVVELAMSKATENKPEDKKETLTASRITDSVSIGKNDLVSKYITIKD